MKKCLLTVLPGLTCAYVVFITTGCGKSTPPAPNVISATVGGQVWLSQSAAGIEPPGLGVITLVGLNFSADDSSQLEIDLTDTIPLHKADPFLHTSVRYFAGDGTVYEGEPAIGAHGVVTVNSLDTETHKVTGTFSGVLYNASNSQDSLAVTNGVFSSSYRVN